MICENGYKVKLANNTERVFKTDLDLDTFIDEQIRQHPAGFESKVPYNDFITRAYDFQKETIEILDEISKEVSSVSRLVSYQNSEDPEDVVSYYIIDGSIGVTKFLQNYSSENGDPFMIPFNEESWEIERVKFLTKELIKQGMSDEQAYSEAYTLVEKEKAAWKQYSKTGEEIHKIYEMVFKDESYSRPTDSLLSQDIFDEVVAQARSLKRDLIEKHGKNAKFYTEFGIISKELSKDASDQLKNANLTSINGKIDLLVIDQNGKAHIYDFKVSRKAMGDWNQNTNAVTTNLKTWHSTKKRGAALQLAFYTKILQQYGIDVATASIIPIKTDYVYEDTRNEIGINKDSLKSVEIGHPFFVPDVLSGKYNTMAKSVFPTDFSLTGIEFASWAETFNKLFPSQSVKKYQENLGRDIEYYRNNSDYVQELLPSDSRYKSGKRFVLYKKGIGGSISVKTEEELREEITNYIQALASKRSDMCVELATRIKNIQGGQAVFDTIADGVPEVHRDWIKTQFKRYFDEHWTFNEDDVLNANGMFIFEKGGVCEIVMISNDPLANVINLGMGTSILGSNTKDMYVNKTKTFEASYGHIRLMECMVYISQNQSRFENKRIQQLRVINPTSGQEVTALNSKLIDNYNQLKLKNPKISLNDLDAGIFVEDVQALIDGAKSRLYAVNPDILDRLKVEDVEQTIDYLNTCIDLMQSEYSKLRTWTDDHIDMSDPIWQAYTMLMEARNYLSGVTSHNEMNKRAYMNKGARLVGTMISSLQNSPSTNLMELGKIIDSFSAEVSKRCHEKGIKSQQLFRAFYKVHGNGTQAFRHWFRTDEHGNIDPRLLLKDPDSPEFSSPAAAADRAALSYVLETLNELRFGVKNDADRQALKDSLQWYEFPLTEGTGISQIKGLGFVTAIKNKWQEFSTLTKDVFAEDEETYLTERRNGKYQTSLYNKFDLTSGRRIEKIQANGGPGFFDLNVERVFNQALVAYTKTEVSKDYLPLVAGLRLSMMYRSAYGKQSMDDIIRVFDKAVKSKLYGESLIEDGKEVYKFISVLRKGFTRMALSLNFTSLFRETLQGIYTAIIRSGVKIIPGVNEKTYLKALEYVIKESPKNVEGVSMLQQLNVIYKMANQSMGSIAKNMRVNWLNIKNWNEDTLFLTATAPDFLHRVSILVAKMMGDGCWEAHSLNERGELVYDFKKDKRFQHFLNDETSHPDYLKEKSLYEKMIEQFNTEGYRKKDGSLLSIKDRDALPMAYTQTEAASIKNFSDLMYGHYDEESKSLFCDTFLGTFIMQYKTFLTSKLEQWIMPQGIHNSEMLKQQFDPETGEELYQIIEYDENENPHRKIVRKSQLTAEQLEKDQARVYFDYEGIPMNGLLAEQFRFFKDIATMNFSDLKELWNNPQDRGFFLIGLHDQWLMMLLAFIVTFITGEFADLDEPMDQSKVRAAVKRMGPAEQLAFNVIWGSTQDSQFQNIVGAFTQNPPMVTQVTRFLNSSWQVLSGQHTIPYALTQNFGAIRNFQGLVVNAEKLANS